MDKKLFEASNAQVNAELYNSYMYFAMSLWAEKENWPGLANWMRVQAQEELVHATTLITQLLERGETPVMEAIEKPPTDWYDPLNVLEEALKAEKETTKRINNLADIAMDIKDHAFYDFIMMFVREQVEEEDSPTKLIAQVKRIIADSSAMYQFDETLAKRVFVPPFSEK